MPNVSERVWALVKRPLFHWGAGVVAALGAGLIAFGGQILNPVEDNFKNTILPEKILILASPVTVVSGDTKPLTLVLKQSGGASAISGGVISVGSTENGVSLIGDTTFQYPASPDRIELVKPALSVRSESPGDQTLSIEVTSNSGKVFTGLVTVRTVAAQGHPNIEKSNFSGSYELEINGAEGEMTVIQSKDYDGRFTAKAKIDGVEYTSTDGYHDGHTFDVTLRSGGGRTYEAHGVWCPVSAGGAEYIVVNGKVVTLEHGRRRANPHIFDSPDKCAEFPSSLDEQPGDGTMVARLPIS